MMNFQTKLRHGKGFVDPVGPSFSSAKNWKINIEGTQVEFKSPKHSPMVKSSKAEFPKQSYIYSKNDMVFRSLNKELVIADVWEYARIFSHDWAFNGPWFTGCLAHVSMSIVVYKSKENNKRISYLHPRAFEQTVGDFLTNQYSKSKTGKQYDYKAPIKWQSISTLNVIAARFQVIAEGIGSVGLPTITEYLAFPIDENHFVAMVFHPSRSARGTEEEIDKKIGYKNLGELIDNIVDSVKITLSPEAKAQQEKALEGLEDTSLVETFLPMDWRKSKSNTKKNEDVLLSSS